MNPVIIFKISLKASACQGRMCGNCLKKKAVVCLGISFAIPLTSSLHSTPAISLWQDCEMARARKQISNQKSFLQREIGSITWTWEHKETHGASTVTSWDIRKTCLKRSGTSQPDWVTFDDGTFNTIASFSPGLRNYC